MRDKYLYIIDIRFKQKNLDLSRHIVNKEAEFLSLTPYSTYLINLYGKDSLTFSNIIDNSDFKKIVLEEYSKIEKFLKKDFLFLLRDFANIKIFEIYLKELFIFFDKKVNNGYKIIYITDANNTIQDKLNENNKSHIYKYNSFYKTVKIENKDNLFYKKNKFNKILSIFLYKKNIFFKIYNKFIDSNLELNYDNIYYKNIYKSIDVFQSKENINIDELDIFTKDIKYLFDKSILYNYYQKVINDFKEANLNFSKISKIKLHPFTFLSNNKNYSEILIYQKNNIPKIFMQHGSYIQENIFLKYNEIYPADINFVFNDYTKKLFEKRGAKKVYSVGSVKFNRTIKNRKKKYDYIYITYCTGYAYSGIQIFSEENNLSIDGNHIYTRHKRVIELFGKNFPEKKLCIKMQSGIVSNMLYIPLLELSKKYNNITIEFFEPLYNLIEKSKYIISDYLSSEFINSSLLDKKSILLFNNNEISIPDNILDDMKKLFIIINSIASLKENIENIKIVTKQLKKDNKLMEYYFLKKCDTKKIIKTILRKELNAT